MDQARLINVVTQFPQVWDRNIASFREQDLKNNAWDKIGEIMNQPVAVCKDTFKSLREKYVREREKQTFWGAKYIRWQYLDVLSFLDPHIILRKQSFNNYEPDTSSGGSKVEAAGFNFTEAENNYDFDRNLIELVKKSTPIWDRRNNGYPSKQVKFQLWKQIGHTLKKDVGVCMIRWKGLREKYIRQKSKYHDGEGSKWEFLDEMTFLDKVIQYRKKTQDLLQSPDYSVHEMPFEMSAASAANTDFYDDNSITSDFGVAVKNEDFGSSCEMSPPSSSNYHHHDSVDSGTSSRKRSASDVSESSVAEKRDRIESLKSPESMFGELVAAMLARKGERDKNFAMIEIMKVLTK